MADMNIEEYLPKPTSPVATTSDININDYLPQEPTPAPTSSTDINIAEYLPPQSNVAPATRSVSDVVTAKPVYKKAPQGGADPLVENLKGMGTAAYNFITGLGMTAGTVGTMATALGPPGGGETNLPQQQGAEAWNALNAGVGQYAQNVADKPGETLRGTAGTLIGGPAMGEFARTGDPTAIKEDPYGTILNVLLAAPAVKPAAYGAIGSALMKTRGILEGTAGGSKVLKGVDWLGAKVVPKYGFTDEAYLAESTFHGSQFLKALQEAAPNATAAGELIATNPKAATFITPELNMSRGTLRALNKGYTKHQEDVIGMGPFGTPLTAGTMGQEFKFNKKGLDVIVDKDGFMRYARAGEFNALTADELSKVMNARTQMDAGHKALYDRGFLTEEEYTAGAWSYAHETYRVFNNQADWIHQLKTNPNTAPIWQSAYNKIAKGMKNPLDQTKPANPAQVENAMWAMLDQAREISTTPNLSTAMGPASSAMGALIKRKQVPAEIKALLGNMEGKFFPVRVGETIHMQNTILLFDEMAEGLTKQLAHDGRPLIIRNEQRSLKPQQNQPAAYFGSSADTRFPPNKKLGLVDPDYIPLKADGGTLNPIWGRKWTDAQVHPDVVDALYTVANPQFSGVFAKALQIWKTGKVADNPPTHINNMIGSVHFSTLGGGSVANPRNWPHYKAALSDISSFLSSGTISPTLQEFMRVGIVRPGMASIEMGADYAKLMNPGSARTMEQWLERYMQWKPQSVTSTIYDMEDQFFRGGLARTLMAKGMTLEQAAIEVNKYNPSYAVSSPVGNFLRGNSNLGPAMSGVGAVIGGPFSSFPLEAMRITLLAAREHPMRLAAANMIPLGTVALGMAASGLTINDYHELLRKQPPNQQGKLLIPVPTPRGPAFVDWTQAIPMADAFLRKEAFGFSNKIGNVTVPMPQGLVLSSPGMAILDYMQNVNPNTGQPIVKPGSGSSAGVSYLLKSVSPFPQAAINATERTMSAWKNVPTTKYEATPQSAARIPFQSLTPQFGNYRYLDDLMKEAKVVQRGRIGGLKKDEKSLRRDRRFTPEEKSDKRQDIKEEQKQIKKGFR